MKKPRNYAAEYARRIARAKERGYSKDVARGHAPKGTIGIARANKLGVKPGFVIGGRRGKGFVATSASRAENLRELGLDGVIPTKTSLNEFVRLLKEAQFTEREAYTLWWS